MPTNDEFKVVIRRRRAGKFPRGLHKLAEGNKEEEPQIDREQVVRQIEAAADEIVESGYGDILLNGLDESLKLIKAEFLQEIICYGLGNFSQSRASKFQLAAILVVKAQYGSKVHLYDPLFHKSEIEILKELNLLPIESNEEAKRIVGETTSLIYLPHCPYQLTNNILFANWNRRRLTNCIILSNSFDELADSIFLKNLEKSGNYLAKIHPFTTEIPLKNSFRYDDIFNGSAFHIFLDKNLDNLPNDFWDCRDEPIYREENCEFVKRSSVT